MVVRSAAGHLAKSVHAALKAGSLAVAAISVAGGVPLVEAADDPAAIEHHGAVANAGDLLDVGGKDEHGEAAVGERAELEVDLVAGADIDAAGRLLEDEELYRVHQPARDADLLLVAAGQRAHHLLGTAGADAEEIDPALRLLGLGGLRHEQAADVAALERGDHVLADGEVADDALALAVGGDEADAARLAERGPIRDDRRCRRRAPCRWWRGRGRRRRRGPASRCRSRSGRRRRRSRRSGRRGRRRRACRGRTGR